MGRSRSADTAGRGVWPPALAEEPELPRSRSADTAARSLGGGEDDDAAAAGGRVKLRARPEGVASDEESLERRAGGG